MHFTNAKVHKKQKLNCYFYIIWHSEIISTSRTLTYKDNKRSIYFRDPTVNYAAGTVIGKFFFNKQNKI